MRQRFKARELWLFAPFLLIGIAALLYWRWEQVTPADKRGFYVSKITRTPATARDEEMGVSHYVTVTLSHGWPRPLWWGEILQQPLLLNPLHPTKPATSYYSATSDKSLASGGLATGIRDGKEVVFESRYSASPGTITFDGTNYQIKHSLSLRGTYQGAGEVVFKGLYRLKNSELIPAQKVVRAQGEQFPPINKNSGMRVVSIQLSPWKKEQITEMNGVLTTTDEIFINVIVEPTTPVPSGKTKHELSGDITDVKDNIVGNFTYETYQGRESDAPKIVLKPEQVAQVFHFGVNEKHRTKGRIYGYGELWMDERWPLPFKFKLPPRPAAMARAK